MAAPTGRFHPYRTLPGRDPMQWDCGRSPRPPAIRVHPGLANVDERRTPSTAPTRTSRLRPSPWRHGRARDVRPRSSRVPVDLFMALGQAQPGSRSWVGGEPISRRSWISAQADSQHSHSGGLDTALLQTSIGTSVTESTWSMIVNRYLTSVSGDPPRRCLTALAPLSVRPGILVRCPIRLDLTVRPSKQTGHAEHSWRR